MKRLVSIWVLGAALAACNGGRGDDADPAATSRATPTPTVSASASTLGGARSVAEETDDFLFEYSYPAEAGKIAELATVLDIQLEQRREELAAEAAAARREARRDGFPYNKHSYGAEWKVVSEVPGWLSLSSAIATYSGGAHGNSTIESLVWDKEGEQARDAKRLFTSPAARDDAFGDRFSEGRDPRRAERRGAPLEEEEAGDTFTKCPGIDELVILLGSSNGRTFNRLTVYAGPYVAGPYAEGAYEVDLNVDRAILAAVKPEYREAFSARN